MKSVLSLVENATYYGYAQKLDFWNHIFRIVKARLYSVTYLEKVAWFFCFLKSDMEMSTLILIYGGKG